MAVALAVAVAMATPAALPRWAAAEREHALGCAGPPLYVAVSVVRLVWRARGCAGWYLVLCACTLVRAGRGRNVCLRTMEY